ncbi:MAG TPA: hypothetical protein VFL56_06075, partial [Solirubrobacterales bacterium]|nr:hypothetical protein [Solirubrobacterales bacterium]
YLLGLVSFRWRHVHTLNRRRFGLALLLLSFIPLALDVPALAVLALLAALIWTVIVFETLGYGEGRQRVRHADAAPPAR